MSFDLEKIPRAEIIAAMFPGQSIDPNDDGLVRVRCAWPGCAEMRHKNGDAVPSALFSPLTGYYLCQTTNTTTSGWRDTVTAFLGASAWGRYREGCFTDPPRSKGEPDLAATWAALEAEHKWTDLYRIDPELSRRYLRAGRRLPGEIFSDSAIGLFDATGELSGIKFRLPPGKRWAVPPKGGHTEDKYVAAWGSRLSGVVFLADRAREGATLLVCAGEKDALVATSHLDPARWAPVSSCVGECPGKVAAAWGRAIAALARGRDVVIAYDGDRPGQSGAWLLARHLEGVATSVRALVLPAADELPPPKGEDRWDVAAYVLERGGAALAELLERAGPVPEAWEPEPPLPGIDAQRKGKGEGKVSAQAQGKTSPTATSSRGTSSSPASRPKIVTSCEIADMTDEAHGALEQARQLGVYQRGGDLVRVVHVDGHARVTSLPEPTLLELLSRAAEWITLRETKDGEWEESPAKPPRDVVRALDARGEWSLPCLDRVVHGPVLRPDGTVLDRPGYDAGARVIYEPRGAEVPRVPERPTQAEARAALLQLQDVVADFPFVAPSDRAAWVALVLTLLARAAIEGPVPLFLVRATSPGTGKSLLADVAALIGTDLDELPRMSQTPNAEEETKAILTLGRESAPIAMIDNIERPLGSDVLAAALTSRRYKGRELGRNASLEVELPVFVATGNNVVVRGDLSRRVLPIDLDAGMENPEARTGFRHPRLVQHVRAHRGELRAAALTILRWYCAEGRPPLPAAQPFGSYEAWSAMIVPALVWLGEADPCAGRVRIREAGDPEGEARRAALQLWWEKWGPAEKTALDVASTAHEELRVALAGLGHGLSPERLDPKRLGYALRALAGRIIGGLRLAPRSGHQSVTRWSVTRAGAPSAATPIAAPEAGPGPAWPAWDAGPGGDDEAWPPGRE